MPFLPLSFCLKLILLSKTDNMAGYFATLCSCNEQQQQQTDAWVRGCAGPVGRDEQLPPGTIRAEGPPCLKGREGELSRTAAINNNVFRFLCSDFFFFSESSWISSWNTVVFLIIIKVVQPAGLEICFVRAQLFFELLSCTSPGIHGDEELMGTKCWVLGEWKLQLSSKQHPKSMLLS